MHHESDFEYILRHSIEFISTVSIPFPIPPISFFSFSLFFFCSCLDVIVICALYDLPLRQLGSVHVRSFVFGKFVHLNGHNLDLEHLNT